MQNTDSQTEMQEVQSILPLSQNPYPINIYFTVNVHSNSNYGETENALPRVSDAHPSSRSTTPDPNNDSETNGTDTSSSGGSDVRPGMEGIPYPGSYKNGKKRNNKSKY